MNKIQKNQNQSRNPSGQENLSFDSIKVLSDLTQKDIERSYNIENVKNTEANYSNRYGWFLRRVIT